MTDSEEKSCLQEGSSFWLDNIAVQENAETAKCSTKTSCLPESELAYDVVSSQWHCDHPAFYCCMKGSVLHPGRSPHRTPAPDTAGSGNVTSRLPTELLLLIISYVPSTHTLWPLETWRRRRKTRFTYLFNIEKQALRLCGDVIFRVMHSLLSAMTNIKQVA